MAGAVERGRLVRVLAVAQHGRALPGRAGPRGEARPLIGLSLGGVGEDVAHPGGDGHVVGRGVHEGLGGQLLALLEGEPARRRRGQHVGVPLGAGDDRDRGVVLGGGAHHRGAADVDLLDALVGRGARGDGLSEGVEVGDDQVERLHLEVRQLLDVGVQAAVGQDAGVDPRVQGLHAAVEALGEAGQVLDLGDRQAQALDQPGRATGGHERHARVVEAADQLLQPGLVVDGDQGSPDRDAVLAHGLSCRIAAVDAVTVPGHPGGRCPDSVTPRWSPTCASRVGRSLPALSARGSLGVPRPGSPPGPSVRRCRRACRARRP